jgi:multiple sugar transport system permease protein
MKRKAGPFFYLFLVVFVFVIMFPFFWILLTSFKTQVDIFGPHAFRPWPEHPTLANYIDIFQLQPFARYILNSLVVATLTTIYSLCIAAFAAYAVARLKFRGKTIFLGVVLAVSMFPQIATLSPIYLFMTKTGLTNSFHGLVIPYTTFALPLAIWNLNTFFRKVPFELEEAAKIDGASFLQTFFRVIFPLTLPGLFTTGILVFIAAWNEFLFSLTLNTDNAWKTIPVGIALFEGQYTVPWGQESAASVVVTIPIVLLVLAFQKRIVSGLTSGAVKE